MSNPGGAGVILSAGASRRMGQPKALLAYEGTTFVDHLWKQLLALPLAWRKVITSPALPLEDYPTLVNSETARGPIGSLQLALRHGAQDAPWLLVMAVDRPTVRFDTLLALIQAAQNSPGDLWVPSYRGQRGHPIIFGQACYADLLAAPDEPGARWVVARHRQARVEVTVDDPAILHQFDTPADLKILKTKKTP